jgi:hypothetical protein
MASLYASWLSMLNGFFVEQFLFKYRSYSAPNSQYKYIHCDLTNEESFHIATLTIAKAFAIVFPIKLYMESFIKMINFNVYNKNIYMSMGLSLHFKNWS